MACLALIERQLGCRCVPAAYHRAAAAAFLLMLRGRRSADTLDVMQKENRKMPRVVTATIAWWTAYAVMLASQVIDFHRMDGQYISWSLALKYSFGGTWTWVPMTLVCYYLALRYPIGKKNLWRAILVHSIAVAGFIVAKAAYMYYTSDYFGWYDEVPPFVEVLDTSLRNNLMLGWMVVGLAHGVVYYFQMQERERRLAELSQSIVSAKLEALRAQVNPHFLFNALNSVAELMHEDLETADRMVVAVACMLRDRLSSEHQQTRTLRAELDVLQNYLFIENIRLGDRLTTTIDVKHDVLDLPVPVLTLQPIVENAIIHAIARSKTPGWLYVEAWRDRGELCIRVKNSMSAEGARKDGNGIGLKIVTDRLALLYGERVHFSRGEIGNNFYCVSIRIPITESKAFDSAGIARGQVWS